MSITFPGPNGPIRFTGPVAAFLRRSQTGGTPPPAADLAAGTQVAKEYLARLVRPEYVSLPFRGPHDLDNWTGETWEIRRAYRALLLKEPAVKAALKSKVAAVASLAPQVLPEDKASPRDRAAARFVDWAIGRSHGGWPGVVRAIAAGALIDGFSVCEKVLAPVAARAWPGFWGLEELAPLDTRYIRLDVDPCKRVTAVRYVKGQAAQAFDPRDFTVYAYQTLWGSPFGISDLRAAYRPAALIEAAVRLRAVLLENFAGPFLVGTYQPGDQGQKDELLGVLREARATGYVVVPDGDEVRVLNLATSADAQFGAAIEDYRKEIYTAIRGAYLPFSEGAAGTRVGNSQVHQGVADLDAWDLAVDVAEVVNRQLVPDLVRPNFGDGVGLPRVSLGRQDPDAALKTLEIVKAVQAAGVPVSAAFVYEASGVEPPSGPDDVAGANRATPPADRAFRQTEYVEADHPRDEHGRWTNKDAPESGVAADTRRRINDLVDLSRRAAAVLDNPTLRRSGGDAHVKQLDEVLAHMRHSVDDAETRALYGSQYGLYREYNTTVTALTTARTVAHHLLKLAAPECRAQANVRAGLADVEHTLVLRRTEAVARPPGGGTAEAVGVVDRALATAREAVRGQDEKAGAVCGLAQSLRLHLDAIDKEWETATEGVDRIREVVGVRMDRDAAWKEKRVLIHEQRRREAEWDPIRAAKASVRRTVEDLPDDAAELAGSLIPYREAVEHAAAGEYEAAGLSAARETALMALFNAAGKGLGAALGPAEKAVIRDAVKTAPRAGVRTPPERAGQPRLRLSGSGGNTERPGGCFPPGTSVSTITGLKPIEAIQPGDRVWGYDLTAGEWSIQEVTNTLAHDFDGAAVAVTLSGETILATGDHPFWVVAGDELEQRPLSAHLPITPGDRQVAGRWVGAECLRVGDILLDRQGDRTAVGQLDIRRIRGTVHNLRVSHIHSYAVGVSQVLVHNKPVPSPFGLAPPTGRGVWDRVTLPPSHPVPAKGLTPEQIATSLPVWTENAPAHGALVVNGRVYLLKTSDRGGGLHYTSGVVPQELVGELGFTAENRNHVEAQAAAIIRRLQLDGVDTRGSYVVVNRPYICTLDGRGCAPNLNQMLGPEASLTVYPSGGNSAGRNVIFQPEIRTFPRK